MAHLKEPMKPSEFLKQAKVKVPSVISSNGQRVNFSDTQAFNATKEELFEAIDRASACLFLCNQNLNSAINLSELIEQGGVKQ